MTIGRGEDPMKIKHDKRRRFRRLRKLATSLIVIALGIGFTLASAIIGLQHSLGKPRTTDEILVNQRYENAQSFTILNEQDVEDSRGTLYLVEWHNPQAIPCIGVIWIKAADSFDRLHIGQSNENCVSQRYSIDQYWGMRTWPRISFSVAFGYSGGAARVVVTWQDDTVSELQPVNGSYLAVNSAKSRVIESVAFHDESDRLLHRFPDSETSGTASS